MFMHVDVPMKRWPVANWALIALTIVLSVRDWAAAPTRRIDPGRITTKTGDRDLERILREIELRTDDVTPLAIHPERFRPWQLVTHAFVHGDVFHLLGNMLFLFCFGNAVNAKLGHLAYLAAYFGLAALAALAWLLLGDGQPALGASGAIAGVTGLFLVLFPLNEMVLYDLDLLWITGGEPWRMASFWFILFHFAWDLIGTIFFGAGGVAYVCHLTGELTGFALAFGLVWAGVLSSDRGERNLLEALGVIDEVPPPRRRRRRPVDVED